MCTVRKYVKPLAAVQWLVFIAGDDCMAPKMIEVICPNCCRSVGNISVNTGSKTIKCRICKNYIRYDFRKDKTELTNRPDRVTSSGLTFC